MRLTNNLFKKITIFFIWILIFCPASYAQNSKSQDNVVGKVTDMQGEPLPDVRIVLKGTTRGAATNVDGEYSIFIPSDIKSPTLVFSFMGMKTKTVLLKGRKVLNVKLEDDSFGVGEVVVTGVLNKPKESFTGAARKITQTELKEAGNRNILKSIANIDPSFLIVENNNAGSNPNQLPEIRIRGYSAIPSVTDLQNDTRANLVTPLFILDGFEITLQQMMDLNNDEIESITILKDASATAMYGSRGANGVVVITSIKPKAGRLKFSYNGSCNLEIPDLSSYNLLNAEDKLELEKRAGLYDSKDLRRDYVLKQIYTEKLRNVRAGINTNWLRMPVRVGVGQNHNLSVNGGDEHFRYNMGVYHNNIVGAMKGSNRKATNLNVRLMYLTKKFSFSNNTSIGLSNQNDLPGGVGFGDYARMNPYFSPYAEDGSLIPYFEKNYFYGEQVDNPVYIASLNSFSKSNSTYITNNFNITYNPFSFIQISSSVSLSKSFGKNESFLSPLAPSEMKKNNDHGLQRGNRYFKSDEGMNWDWSTSINYYNTFGKHSVTMGINHTIFTRENEGRSFRVKGYINDKVNALMNADSFSDPRPNSYNTKSRSVGLTASVNYVYDNRYYLDASYRLDGSSSFGRLSRWAPFYSVGCGWTVTNEPWMKSIQDYITHLKFRYSFGASGSQNFSPWQSIGTYKLVQTTYHGGFIAQKQGLENPDLKWQTTFQHNTGGDASFFKGLFSISFNYYYKLTKDAITSVGLPLTNGVEKFTSNQGDILNKGYDMDFSIFLYRNYKRNISWNVRLGLSHNTNRIVKLSNAMKNYVNEQIRSPYNPDKLKYLLKEGQSIDAIYAIKTYGVDPSTGKVLYRYKDGSQGYKYSVDEQVPCGDRMAKVDTRISTSFQWGKFNIYAGFSLRLGAHVYNSTLASKVENVNLHFNVDQRVFDQRWQKPGDLTHFMGLGENNYYITDRYIQKENSLVCHNISISYDLTNKWVKKLGVSGLYFNSSIGNVFYISTIKKERGTGYPYALQPSFGIMCAF